MLQHAGPRPVRARADPGRRKARTGPVSLHHLREVLHDKARRTQIDIGVMSYAGLHDVLSQFFHEADDDLESHEEHLRLAYDLGKTSLAAERA